MFTGPPPLTLQTKHISSVGSLCQKIYHSLQEKVAEININSYFLRYGNGITDMFLDTCVPPGTFNKSDIKWIAVFFSG